MRSIIVKHVYSQICRRISPHILILVAVGIYITAGGAIFHYLEGLGEIKDVNFGTGGQLSTNFDYEERDRINISLQIRKLCENVSATDSSSCIK
uniref:Uncharacterized protein n=1 Tax=Romanomermis culicivorax TaxID=13658 RepID=A0A915L1X0_ROMCU